MKYLKHILLVSGAFCLLYGGIVLAGSFSSRYNDSSGDMVFGEIYSNDSATTTVGILAGTDYTKITTFTTNGESNGIVPDHTTDTITFNRAGIYKVTGSFSFQADSNNTNYRGSAFYNGDEQVERGKIRVDDSKTLLEVKQLKVEAIKL